MRRDHGGGLWTFEDQDGQLYLAVKSREFAPVLDRPLWANEQELLDRAMADLGRVDREYPNSAENGHVA